MSAGQKHSWGKIFSIKSIKELVESKKNFSLDPFDYLKKPVCNSHKNLTKALPPIELKLTKQPSLSAEPKSSKIFDTSGPAESQFRKVCNECNSTRKGLKKIKRSCTKKQFVLKGMIRNCKKFIKETGRNEYREEMSPEYLMYKEKMKLKKRKKL